MLIKEGWQQIMTKPYWSVGVRHWWRSPLSGAWWIAPEISSNTYFDVDVDKYLKKKFNDKSTMVRGGSSLVEITFVGRETLGGNSTAEKRSQIRMQPYLQQIQFWPRSMGTPGDKFVRNESSRSERSWFSPMTLIKNKCLLESCSPLIVGWYFLFGST